MGAIVDLLKSERGILALGLVIASTVLAGLGSMTVEMWKEFNLYIFGIYVAGKTATGVTGILTSSKSSTASEAPTSSAASASDKPS
ncbi:MAG: hypothetical protein Q6370_010605 [Candidatus Sigynarchaeota archaeon]|jgi:hypothetical protein